MILEQIIVGPLQTNCYIIGCEKTLEAAVIDPGDEMDKIITVINENNINVKYIFVTHAHVDHIAHLLKLKQEIHAEIVMHADDQFLFDTAAIQAMMFGLSDPGNPEPDRLVSDNEIIKVGDLEVKVLHTPGHSPGSVTYHVDNHLFVGDLIFAGSIGRTDLPGGNYTTLINSVKSKIFTLADETIIYPGHGPSTSVGEEKKYNPFFNSYSLFSL